MDKLFRFLKINIFCPIMPFRIFFFFFFLPTIQPTFMKNLQRYKAEWECKVQVQVFQELLYAYSLGEVIQPTHFLIKFLRYLKSLGTRVPKITSHLYIYRYQNFEKTKNSENYIRFFIFAVKDIIYRNLIEAYKDSKHILEKKIPLLKVSNTS